MIDITDEMMKAGLKVFRTEFDLTKKKDWHEGLCKAIYEAMRKLEPDKTFSVLRDQLECETCFGSGQHEILQKCYCDGTGINIMRPGLTLNEILKEIGEPDRPVRKRAYTTTTEGHQVSVGKIRG